MKTGIDGILRLTAVLLLASALPAFWVPALWAATGNIDVNEKFAWSETAGWLNFRPIDAGVKVYPDHLEGYAWAQNLGWIKLGSGTAGGTKAYSNMSAADWGVNHDGAGNLSGYAWSDTAGWINFNPTDGQVSIDMNNGGFSGYAWAQNFGWIHFESGEPVEYQVTVHWPEVSFSLANYMVDENGDYVGDPVTVRRTNPYGASEVEIALSDGTANGGVFSPIVYPADYQYQLLTASFTDGETEKTLGVRINDDNIDEPDETLTLSLHSPVNARLGTRTESTLYIRDNDDPPEISISDAVAMAEGDSGVTEMLFRVTLSEESGKPVYVDYSTADETATAGTDYIGHGATLLTFRPGDMSQTIRVEVLGDLLNEPEQETFFVNLSSAENATIADDQAIGTILNDDPVPTISVYDSAAEEGDTGTAYLNFTIVLSEASGKEVTVKYATADNTAIAAEGDYTPISGQTLTFAPGERSKEVSVSLAGDEEIEADETFFLVLSDPVNAEIADNEATGTIIDDDSPSRIDVDYSGNDVVDLEDAIIALKVLAGIDPGVTLSPYHDVNDNRRIDIAEVLYILQKVSDLR